MKLSKLMSEKRQLAGNRTKKSGEDGLVPKLLKTRNFRIITAGMELIACSISDRLQFQDVFIFTELWFFLIEHARVSTGKTKSFPAPTQSVQLFTKDCEMSSYMTRRLSNGHFRDTYGVKFLPWSITATLHQDICVLPSYRETPPERLENGGLNKVLSRNTTGKSPRKL
ncbi:hypothetical protein PHPALM_29817 [Phytophthora palmivora]|uniref:Uncharacterized protein n=1 Tax=Phytophthora palmivora TaxID=4796 RepID=A0A2P4X6L7_9STRA|nr:hypothetical protein PHPALM_29817 [Phytophthora palmivora]